VAWIISRVGARRPVWLVAIVVALAVGLARADDGIPATAADADFAASRGVDAEAQLRERLLARVRTIGTTQTRYLLAGFVQLDGIAARRRQDGDEQDTLFPSATPFGPAPNERRGSVRQSQFNVLTHTPTGAGPVWTRLEANLFPLDGTTRPTLNQLFVRWDEHLVVGKTYATFMDDGILPTTLDYHGPAGVTFVRQALVRGRVVLDRGFAVEAALEDAQADVDGAGAAAVRPDVAARLRYEGAGGGHLQLAALSRRIRLTTSVPVPSERTVTGSGVSLSGALPLRTDDRLMFQLVTGTGIARYFNDPLAVPAVALRPGTGIDLSRTSGATVYYQRTWTPDWVSTAGLSTAWVDGDGTRPPQALRRSIYASLNLLHRLTPTLIVGAEALWGEAQRVDGERAGNARLQASIRYLVF
jgi:hypothetical protein